MARKRCFRCGRRKALADFYRHPTMADGHLGKCKSCARADVARWRKRKHAEIREVATAYQRKRRRELPGRVRAYRAVARAVRAGDLLPERCAKCGRRRTEAHHPDYRRPLFVVWLCRRHHVEAHYREDVAA